MVFQRAGFADPKRAKGDNMKKRNDHLECACCRDERVLPLVVPFDALCSDHLQHEIDRLHDRLNAPSNWVRSLTAKTYRDALDELASRGLS